MSCCVLDLRLLFVNLDLIFCLGDDEVYEWVEIFLFNNI